MDRSQFDIDKTIDPGQLDVEAVQQAGLFFKYAEESVKAKAQVDRMKMALDVMEAKLQAEVRESPEKFGLVKVTEAAIAAAVKTSTRYTDAYDAFLKAREVSGLVDVAREAMEQKKRMIEVLVTLHGQQYFAGPSVPRNLVDAWQEHQKNVTGEVNDRQIGRARKRARKED